MEAVVDVEDGMHATDAAMAVWILQLLVQAQQKR
jgi:hypothetical protein